MTAKKDLVKNAAGRMIPAVVNGREQTPFKGFRAAVLPEFPVFNPRAPEIIKDYLDQHGYQQGQQA